MKTFSLIGMLVMALGGKAIAQSGLYARGSLQLATEAEVYLSTLQPGLGIGKTWTSRLGVLLEYYHFSDSWNASTPDCPWEGYLKQGTLALMGSYYFRSKNKRSLYFMGGLAFQARRSEYLNMYGKQYDNLNFLTGAFEFGYRWPIKKSPYGIAVSMKFTGPTSYSYNLVIPNGDPSNPNGGDEISKQSVTEIITQLSIGVVVDRSFVTGANKKKKTVKANPL